MDLITRIIYDDLYMLWLQFEQMLVEISHLEPEEDAKEKLEEAFDFMQNLSSLQVEIMKWRMKITMDEKFWKKFITKQITGPKAEIEKDGKKRKAIIFGLEKYQEYVVKKVRDIVFSK